MSNDATLCSQRDLSWAGKWEEKKKKKTDDGDGGKIRVLLLVVVVTRGSNVSMTFASD